MLLELVLLCWVVTGVTGVTATKPNIIIMYMDDMGWGDIGANGACPRNNKVL